jgi:hypothetical protein
VFDRRMRCLVTGATGFLGRNIVDRLCPGLRSRSLQAVDKWRSCHPIFDERSGRAISSMHGTGVPCWTVLTSFVMPARGDLFGGTTGGRRVLLRSHLRFDRAVD